jgi:O-antigen/teichoic acid export membrane protein
MVAFKWVERLIGLVSTLILARLLVPADFGLVAMATSFIALLEVVGNLGVDSALIQSPKATREHYDTAWTFNMLIGLGTALIAVASAPALADFYNDPRVTPVLCAMALASLLQGAENIGTVDFRKYLDFRREFRYQAAKKAIGFLAVVPLALMLRSYWALVIGTIVARVGGLGLSFWMSPYRPRPCLRTGRELFVFSRWLLIGGVVVFARQRASDFVIGRFGGARSLGLFNIASELGTMPATEIVMPVSRAAFPVYSTIAHDLPALASSYLRVLGLVALLSIPAGAGIAVTADLLVPVLFGDKWLDATPILAFMGLYGVTLALQGNIFPVFLARGKPQYSVWVVAFQLACLLPLLYAMTRTSGATGAGIAYFASGCLSMPVALHYAARELGIPLSRTMAVLWRPLVAASVMYLTLTMLWPALPADAGIAMLLLRLLLEIMAGVLVFVLAIFVLWWPTRQPADAESSALQFARARLGRLARRPGPRERTDGAS